MSVLLVIAGRHLHRALERLEWIMMGWMLLLLGALALLYVPGPVWSALAGGFALGLILIPIVLRITEEMVRLVPSALREAGLGLGLPEWMVSLRIVIPAARAGIITGVMVAVARIAGETAPLLFTSSIAANQVSTDVTHALPTLPVSIFVFSESPDPNEQAMGWAAALVLILFVLVLNIVAKVVAARQRRRSEGA